MARREKRLEAMRASPQGDWTKEDVFALCDGYQLDWDKPKGTSHFTISDPTQIEIVTVVAAKPIKPIYIKRLVAFVDAVQIARRAAMEAAMAREGVSRS